MELIYNVQDKPKFRQLIVFAFQQLLAIMAATIAVPAIIGNGMTASAALFGAGAGTIAYLLITKLKSPVFLFRCSRKRLVRSSRTLSFAAIEAVIFLQQNNQSLGAMSLSKSAEAIASASIVWIS